MANSTKSSYLPDSLDSKFINYTKEFNQLIKKKLSKINIILKKPTITVLNDVLVIAQ